MWAGMSSGPSIVCVQYGASSGTTALKYDSKSSRTSGEAFSFSVNDADVWRMNRCSSPTRTSRSSGSAVGHLAGDEVEPARQRAAGGSRAEPSVIAPG